MQSCPIVESGSGAGSFGASDARSGKGSGQQGLSTGQLARASRSRSGQGSLLLLSRSKLGVIAIGKGRGTVRGGRLGGVGAGGKGESPIIGRLLVSKAKGKARMGRLDIAFAGDARREDCGYEHEQGDTPETKEAQGASGAPGGGEPGSSSSCQQC